MNSNRVNQVAPEMLAILNHDGIKRVMPILQGMVRDLGAKPTIALLMGALGAKVHVENAANFATAQTIRNFLTHLKAGIVERRWCTQGALKAVPQLNAPSKQSLESGLAFLEGAKLMMFYGAYIASPSAQAGFNDDEMEAMRPTLERLIPFAAPGQEHDPTPQELAMDLKDGARFQGLRTRELHQALSTLQLDHIRALPVKHILDVLRAKEAARISQERLHNAPAGAAIAIQPDWSEFFSEEREPLLRQPSTPPPARAAPLVAPGAPSRPLAQSRLPPIKQPGANNKSKGLWMAGLLPSFSWGNPNPNPTPASSPTLFAAPPLSVQVHAARIDSPRYPVLPQRPSAVFAAADEGNVNMDDEQVEEPAPVEQPLVHASERKVPEANFAVPTPAGVASIPIEQVAAAKGIAHLYVANGSKCRARTAAGKRCTKSLTDGSDHFCAQHHAKVFGN